MPQEKRSYSSLPADMQAHVARLARASANLEPFQSAEIFVREDGVPDMVVETRHKVPQAERQLREEFAQFLFTDYRITMSRFSQSELVINYTERMTVGGVEVHPGSTINDRAKG